MRMKRCKTGDTIRTENFYQRRIRSCPDPEEVAAEAADMAEAVAFAEEDTKVEASTEDITTDFTEDSILDHTEDLAVIGEDTVTEADALA